VENKHGGQYGKQIVMILDSLFDGPSWWIGYKPVYNPESGRYIYELELTREELLAQPDIQAAQDYIKEKEDL